MRPSPAGYQVELETRDATEVTLRPSFFYQFSEGEPGRPTLRIAASAIPKEAYKQRFVGALYAGSDPSAVIEYFHPFNGSAFFIAPGIGIGRMRFSQYFGDSRQDQSRRRSFASLYFGIGTWRQVQLRLGARGGFDNYSDPVSVGGIPASDTRFLNTEVVGIINSQDSGLLPTRGLRLNASSGWSFREHSFPYLEMNFDHFQPVGKDFSLIAMGKTDTSMGRKLTFYDQFTAGGFTELDGYRYQEIRGDTILMGGLGFLYRGTNPKSVDFRPIWGSWYEAAAVNPRATSSQTRQSATVAVFTPTPLGLVGLSMGMDLKGSVRWRLSIGSFWNRP
jgi:NTE family protein